jgi:hypothetical protein
MHADARVDEHRGGQRKQEGGGEGADDKCFF